VRYYQTANDLMRANTAVLRVDLQQTESAIDDERRSSYVPRNIARPIDGEGADLLRPAEPAHAHWARKSLHGLGLETAQRSLASVMKMSGQIALTVMPRDAPISGRRVSFFC
jgi:hypothetical protein